MVDLIFSKFYYNLAIVSAKNWKVKQIIEDCDGWDGVPKHAKNLILAEIDKLK